MTVLGSMHDEVAVGVSRQDSCRHAQTLGAMQNEYRKEELVSQLISMVDPTEQESALETILESVTMSGGHFSLSSMLGLSLFECSLSLAAVKMVAECLHMVAFCLQRQSAGQVSITG